MCVLDVLDAAGEERDQPPAAAPDARRRGPRLTLTQPAGVTAASGMDILCHALESWTARPYDSYDRKPPSSGCPTAAPTRSATCGARRR